MARHKEEMSKTQNEVDRLLEIMKEMEEEKNDKDKRVTELERYMKCIEESIQVSVGAAMSGGQ